MGFFGMYCFTGKVSVRFHPPLYVAHISFQIISSFGPYMAHFISLVRAFIEELRQMYFYSWIGCKSLATNTRSQNHLLWNIY